MIIRWMGAFSKGGSLGDSLRYEFTNRNEVAAEILQRGRSQIDQAVIGLLVKGTAVRRRYKSDVWSLPQRRKLVATRKVTSTGTHTECFVAPVFMGIVLKRAVGKDAMACVVACANRENLNIFRLLKNGSLVQITK